ncbi:hypothetical protein [Botrimarina sp.]|uniref:hypothetical protein n=1 Tax=Botrimarina sp. TaxID=2795802 RepID=UPI0032ECC0CE
MQSVPQPNRSTAALARLVQQKRRLLEQLVALSRRQEQLVEEGEIGALLELLSGKQHLITGLGVVEQGLDAFRGDDPDDRPWPTAAERQRCQADAQACNELLRQALESEKRHEELLSRRRDDLAGRLRQAQSAHAASTAYKPHLAPRRPAPPAAAAAPAQPLSACLDVSTSD